MTVTTTELRPGYRIARLIKGGWQLAGGHGEVAREAALADMAAYVEAGLTTFDCADIYTGVEELIGAFRRTLSPEARAALKVHTKCVPDLAMLQHLARDDVARLIDRSRARLGMERLDLVQLHWWDYAAATLIDAARWLRDMQDAGRIDLLGGTNFDTAHTQTMLDAGVRLATMQVQYSLLDDRPSRGMAALCARSGMKLLCYGTLAGGFLGHRWLGADEPSEPLENRSLTKYKLVIDDCGGWDWFQALLRALAGVAARHDADIGAIASRYVLDLPHVAAVIVGVRRRDHLAQHRRLCGIALTEADRRDIAGVLAQRRTLDGDVYALERDRAGRHGRIMKYNLNA